MTTLNFWRKLSWTDFVVFFNNDFTLNTVWILFLITLQYRNEPKVWTKRAEANSVAPDQIHLIFRSSLVRVYTVYHSIYIFRTHYCMDRVKRIWYLSPMRAAKVQASLRIRAVSPEPPLLAHTSSESRGTFRQKARSLASLNGWACAVKTCRDGMLEDTNSLDGARMVIPYC